VLDDVVDWSPDLVIFEVPIINMITTDQTIAYSVNHVHDAVWGDRSGAENTWALTQNCDAVLLVLPHHIQRDYNSNGTDKEAAADVTYDQIYRAVRALVYEKADDGVALIDMSTAFEREIDADPLWPNYFMAMDGSSVTGATY